MLHSQTTAFDRNYWMVIWDVLKVCRVGEGLLSGVKLLDNNADMYQDKWRNEWKFFFFSYYKGCKTKVCDGPKAVCPLYRWCNKRYNQRLVILE